MDPKLLVLVDDYLKAEAACTEATQDDITYLTSTLARLQKVKEQKALQLAEYIAMNLQGIMRSQSPKL